MYYSNTSKINNLIDALKKLYNIDTPTDSFVNDSTLWLIYDDDSRAGGSGGDKDWIKVVRQSEEPNPGDNLVKEITEQELKKYSAGLKRSLTNIQNKLKMLETV